MNKIRVAFLIYASMFFSSKVFSQNETNYWYFGQNAGINFSNGEENVLTNSSMTTPAGCSSISDNNGDLLFYTNGRTIWNKNHQIMINGDNLYGDIVGVQTSIIIPKPNDESTFFVIVTREFNVGSPETMPKGVFYSEVTFTSNEPLGIVTIKNERIADTATARLAATYHYETNSYRLICLTESDTPPFGQIYDPYPVFRVFQITENGINLNPILWQINEALVSFGGMKVSPDSQYIVVVDNALQKIYFYKFNNDTITFELHLNLGAVPEFGLFFNPYTIEFSQNSKMFYYAGDDYIVQLPFTTIGDISPLENYIIDEQNVSSIQLARNGKIYITKGDIDNPSNTVSVIHKPEKYAQDCNFQSDAIELQTGNATKGLPIFASTFLRNHIVLFDDDCVSASFNFSLDTYAPVDAVQWDFDDGVFSNELEPIHQFSTPGIKKVKAVISLNNRTMTLYKKIEVFPLPELDDAAVLTQCDDNNDGFSIFNLENISDYLNFSNADFQYAFYTSINDATNDVNQIQNPINYANVINPQEITVKIISHKGCVSIESFFIESQLTSVPVLPNMYVCDSSDGVFDNAEGLFNLNIKAQEIISLLNFPESYSLNFYASLLDAQTKLNNIDRSFITATTVIWIRIEDENFNCFGVVSFNAVVNPFLSIDIEDIYVICPFDDSPVILDGGSLNDTWVWTNRVGSVVLSNERFFDLTQIGNFNITVTKQENGITCSKSKDFGAINSEIPIVKKITADDSTIYIAVQGNGNYTYSLDDNFYYGSGTSHTFTNLEAGIYTVYIKDENGCKNLVSSSIHLFNFPKFFTPNDDQVNDYWKVSGNFLGYFSTLEIKIFNRYGKLVYTMNLKKNEIGWDGSYNKERLAASDYWFKMTLTDLNKNEIVKKGHFSLIR